MKADKSRWFDTGFLVSLSMRVFGAFAILIYMSLMLWKFEAHVTADMFFLLASAPLVSTVLKAGQENRLIIVTAKTSIERSKTYLLPLISRYIFSALLLAGYILLGLEYSKFAAIFFLGQFLAQHSLVSGYLQGIGKLNTSLLIRLCLPGLIILVMVSLLSQKTSSVVLFYAISVSYLVVFSLTLVTLFLMYRQNIFIDIFNKGIIANLKLRNVALKIIKRPTNRDFAIFEGLSSVLQTFPILICGLFGDSGAVIFMGYLSRVAKVPKVFVSMYTNFAVQKHAKTYRSKGSLVFFSQIIRQAKMVFFALLSFTLCTYLMLILVAPMLNHDIQIIDTMAGSSFVVLTFLLGESFGAPALVMANRFLIVDRLPKLNFAIFLSLLISALVFIFGNGIASVSYSYLCANLILILLVSKLHANSL